MQKEVLSNTYNRIINSKLTEEFQISNSGIYLIKIQARTKSWWQNLPSFFKRFFSDDELQVYVDATKEKLFWNGNDNKGLRKTGIIISKLSVGKHWCIIEPKNTPLLETFQIFELNEKESNIRGILEQNIEDGDRRPWLEIFFNRVALTQLSIKAFSESGRFYGITDRDDDDLQITINKQVIRNEEPKSHQNWYWCGRSLKGGSKVLEIKPENDREIKSIELKTDRSPRIESFTLILEAKSLKKLEEIKDKIISESKNFGYDQEILLRLAEIESHFDPLVTSPNGQDKGIFQLKDVTLTEIKRISGREINPFDAESNIEGGLIYFDYLYKKYKNGPDALKTTLVAWNVGPTYVDKNYPLNFNEIPDITKKLIGFVLDQN